MSEKLCLTCGKRGMCATCDPEGFERAVEAVLRKALAEGHIGGVVFTAVSRDGAQRYLASILEGRKSRRRPTSR